MAQTKTVAVINESKILVIENGSKLVPIRPICKALGIDEDGQKRKIENDDILNSVANLRLATGSDGKQYEMFCIPFKYIFGWLFTINPKNVKPEAREFVLSYKKKCYDVLYQNFVDTQEFLEAKQKVIEERLVLVDQAKANFKNAKGVLDEENKNLKKARELTFEEWLANNRQMNLFENGEEENYD
ncbi:chromosome partitioning protein ParA [Echinicola strongylocentroti]|uniref:Chromosome partitioning protein ParA n=1 Tax=Echinicola strongylocentroti TaxID=1795355 RepID=A0A2Z4ILK6_9BACT|nr:phage antirepressor N-terminal domain-containing protein [Echinicola strongylocentroti]AWW31815.1 chromosome partitioning protein ParA [Echinicola strongylocentroti]